jgi:hypothetical protein
MDVAAVGLKEAIDNQVGPRSNLAQLLTPGEPTALIAAIQRTVDALLVAQREKVVGEFCLDRQDSALARLLTELIPPAKRLESIVSCLFRGRNGSPHGTRNVIRLRPSDSERWPRWSNATRTR